MMKILAQHGHQPSDKIVTGLKEKVLDGVIFSARYADPIRMKEQIEEARTARRDAEVMIDPEFYATRQIGTPNCQLGYLEDWNYFVARGRRELVRSDVVEKVLKASLQETATLDVSALIAPNIYISQSFDSMEAGISLNFVAGAKAASPDKKKHVYATLAIDRRALLNTSDFSAFLNDLTMLENPPDGYYVLVGGGLINERTDLAHSEVIDASVISGWMLLNFALSQNGLKVINGCADLLMPFLGTAGGYAGATGWWSNLRVFSMGRYIKPEKPGGVAPIPRYLSKLLLNRVKLTDLVSYSKMVPAVLNRLPHDKAYVDGTPARTIEALQTWESLQSLVNEIVGADIEQSLENLSERIERAKGTYARMHSRGVSEGIETVTEYLDQLSGALDGFKKLAEI